MKPSPAAKQQLAFDAELKNWAEGMDYCAVDVPAEITEALGTKGPVLVSAQVNESQPFMVSLFPVGGGRHCIRIKAKVRSETNTKTGDCVRVRFTVLDRSDITVPEELMHALATLDLTQAFHAMPPGKRNFIVRRVDETVKPQTREKRIQEGVQAAQQHQLKSSGTG
jgi:hypothetical protein